ncbi:MAG: Stp1/IreP family PP2C-type Ser/Thr phosphatase [Acidobacteriota bacterium]
MLRITSAAASHPGLRREDNEDSYCVRPDLGLFLVADGMGGHAAGEVASRLAVDTIEAFLADTKTADVNRTWPFPYDPAISLDQNRLRAAFRLANRRIAQAMDDNEALRGMATTAVALLVGLEHEPAIAHVGDSRIYLWRGDELQQVTQDHSWVSEQVRAGIMTEADARRHPWRNVVTRALAGGDDPDVDLATVPVLAGDRFLICSDGLSSVVTKETIESSLAAHQSLDQTCQTLIAAANAAGGPDNITVALIQVDVE